MADVCCSRVMHLDRHINVKAMWKGYMPKQANSSSHKIHEKVYSLHWKQWLTWLTCCMCNMLVIINSVWERTDKIFLIHIDSFLQLAFSCLSTKIFTHIFTAALMVNKGIPYTGGLVVMHTKNCHTSIETYIPKTKLLSQHTRVFKNSEKLRRL